MNRLVKTHNPQRPLGHNERRAISKLADSVAQQFSDNASQNASPKPSQRDLAVTQRFDGGTAIERTEATLRAAYERANGRAPDRNVAKVLRSKVEQIAQRRERRD